LLDLANPAGAWGSPDAGTGAAATVSNVSLSRPFFNPALGQKIQISFEIASSGTLMVLILDRDGYLVRKLVADKVVEKGRHSFDWDGRGDKGEVVADEAYSLKIELRSGDKIGRYFPALTPATEVAAKTNYYDRRGATLSYQLPQASRVHIQAGVAQLDPITKRTEGPVLRTIVNREPRPAGAVIENWNGFDEGSTFYVPDLPHFVVSVAATVLPENAIIAIGNRGKTFLEGAAARTGASLLPAFVTDHSHHRGLTALQDVAPALKALPLNASWSAKDRVWRASGRSMKVSVALKGPSADAFERQPGKLYVFVDKSKVFELAQPHAGSTIPVPLERLSAGPHVVAINWASAYGPVAVDAFRVVIGKPSNLQPAAFK
jgi:hypothetical protein